MPLQLLAAGSNASGQLANGTQEDAHMFRPSRFHGGILLSSADDILQLVAGGNHTVVLIRRKGINELWGAGDNSKGQLGPSLSTDTVHATFHKLNLNIVQGNPEMVAASWESTFVVVRPQDGSGDVLLGFGGNGLGVLGVVEPSSTFVVIPLDHLAPLRDFSRFRISRMAAGLHHVVLSLQVYNAAKEVINELLIGWGASRHGQLGETVALSLPTSVLPNDEPVQRVEMLAAGQKHTVFVLQSGRAQGLGADAKGQLDGIASVPQVKQVGCTWNGTYLVNRAGELYPFGSGTKGQLGGVEAGQKVGLPSGIKSLACGSEHVLVSVEDEVWGWGWNEHGNLGIGHTSDVHQPQIIHERSSGRVKGIWAGCGTSWIAVAS